MRNLADNIHTYTVQCSLPINLFNEKIFLIIWFWLYFTMIFTLIGFIYWTVSFFYPDFNKNIVRRFVSSMKRISIHHFPQNPFEEQIHHRSFHHHFHAHHHAQSLTHHRRFSFGHSSYHGSMHGAHHHHFLQSFANRSIKAKLDSARLSRVREQLELPIANETIDATAAAAAATTASTPEERTSPSPHRNTEIQSDSVSVVHDENQLMTSFLRDYLGRDGTLVLYLLRINTNEVITGEIVKALFDLFKTNYRTNTTD